MRLVSNLGEIEANIAVLERARHARDSSTAREYRSLIKRGTCFLPYEAADSLAFAPSRFIGYAGNSFERHRKNTGRDGRRTNRAINELLGAFPEPDVELEQLYRAFCTSIGIEAAKTGTFGVRRKYWIAPELRSALEDLAEDSIKADPGLSATEKSQLVRARRGQGRFRDQLMRMWNERCCATDCEVTVILRASHIKPWRVSSNRERLDRFNGLLLAPNIDALFDKGLISFTDEGKLLISPALGAERAARLGCPADIDIGLTGEHAPYLGYHRERVFQRS